MLGKGDTILMPKQSGQTPHLWVFLTDRDLNGKAVAVNITTKQSYSETTVVLQAGEHSFVIHESVAFYTDARELNVAMAETLLASPQANFICLQKDSCTSHLLDKLQKGLLTSPNVSSRLKSRCALEWGVPYP